MTVSSSTSRNSYVGTGAVSVYPYSFRIYANTDLVVIKGDASGIETTLALTTDYTVSGVGSYSGGNVTLVAGALPSNYTLSIRRVLSLLQPTDLRNAGDFLAETHETVFDRLTMIAQQQQDSISRCFTISANDSGSASLQLPVASARANRILGFDVSGNVTTITATSVAYDGAVIGGAAPATAGYGETRIGFGIINTASTSSGVLNIDSSAASGAAVTIKASGVAVGYLGSAKAILGGSNLSTDLTLTSKVRTLFAVNDGVTLAQELNSTGIATFYGAAPAQPATTEVKIGNGLIKAGTSISVDAGAAGIGNIFFAAAGVTKWQFWNRADAGGSFQIANGAGSASVTVNTDLSVKIQGATPATPAATEVNIGNGIIDTYSGIKYRGNYVLQARQTGWTAATGTATRTSFATGSVTLPNLAQAVKALIDDLINHGLIGA